eukprot:208334-Prymnesium_polylepis.1
MIPVALKGDSECGGVQAALYQILRRLRAGMTDRSMARVHDTGMSVLGCGEDGWTRTVLKNV